MIPHKNNNGKDFGLGDRLAACIERVGSKRAMCSATLISEAQLFRYLNRETDVPSDKLVAIAKAANVDAGWLLTGEGATDKVSTELRPSFRPELMVQIVQVFEELLVEFEKSFNPRQRARALTFLYNALRHEESVRKMEYQLSKFDLLKSLNFLSEVRSEEELEILNTVLTLLEYSEKPIALTSEQLELLTSWTNLQVRGTKGYYSSYPGQVYFERKSGGQLEPSAVLDLQNIVMQACKLGGKTHLDWLDIGCGSGRHLMHLAKHSPNVTLKGIELSQLGYNICKDLMNAEKLPADCVTMGDMRKLPFAAQSFDVIFAHLSLYCLPYLPGTGLGLEEAIQEVARVLRPNGLAKISFPMGNWRDYSMSYQFMDEALIKQLVSNYPFEITQMDIQSLEPGQLRLNHEKYLHVMLKKL